MRSYPLIVFLAIASGLIIPPSLRAAEFGLIPKKQIDTHARIGVLANRGAEICLQEWQPTADYLSRRLAPIAFEIVPLSFEEVIEAAKTSSVCYIAANPSYYAYLERHGLARRIATLQVPGDPEPQAYFGGVIFTRADREDLQTLRDLRGKRFAAVNPQSLGGWHAAWREIVEAGLNPVQHFISLDFLGTHDAVAQQVMSGAVDAGTVRSTQLERMANEGLIDLDNLRVINSRSDDYPHYPYLLSTQLYPEWSIAALPCSPNDLNRQIVIALLEMSEVGPEAQAMRSAGWTIPQDYAAVHEMLRVLRLPPYEHYGQVTLAEAIRQHWIPSLIIVTLVAALLIALSFVSLSNHQVREAQRQLRRSHEDLTLAHRDITVSAAEAQRANRVKTQFISNISHEIRTPLNAIINFAIMLKDKLPDTRSQRQAEIIHSSGQMLLRLITDVLDLSLMESGRLAIKTMPTQVEQILQEVMEIFRQQAIEKHLTLDLIIETPLPQQAELDPLRLRQILVHLLSNAVKFTKEGGIEIRVAAQPSGQNPDLYDLTITVRDSGIGISEDFRPHLFEAFVQDPCIDHAQYGGTGLGLTIVAQLLECMNGTIDVQPNRMGKGTDFTVLLPNVRALAPDPNDHRWTSAEDEPSTRLNAAIYRPALGKEMIDRIESARRSLHIATIAELGRQIQAAGQELSSDELADLGVQLVTAADQFDVPRIQKLLALLAG